VIFIFVKPLAGIFTDDPEVLSKSVVYLRIVLIGAIGLNLYTWNGQVLNAIGKSIVTFTVNAGGTIGLMMPLVYLGGQFSFEAMLTGLACAQLIVGYISTRVSIKVLNIQEHILKRVA